MSGTLKKSFGQHLLKNPGVITELVEKGRIRSSDTVLEIGPGTGNLTLKLLEKAQRVIAVEKDRKILSDLLKRVGPLKKKLQVIIGDAVEVEYPEFDLCISNTPYQISSPLTFKLLQYKFRACILMFQREFALRLCASPGDSYYCRLSVSVQIRANVQHIMKVSRKSFRPPPKVESSIVRIEPKRYPADINMDEYDGLVKICFSRKNKTISSIFHQNAVKNLIFGYRNVLEEEPENTEISREQEESLKAALQQSTFEKERASKMTPEDFLFLLIKFKENGISFAA
ncbi:18S rRNA (adenine1779-N6/adenine1780-N6)-dimethyltransferase [Nematocida sp. LUAm3]|nr:18S rRNA (adenine1779-N6/adenine1780-N6)-dimethyltransferase [Nematocida sp. LUAm3]KAI5173891.1 18S rRNA (adenine1779-N6/adenine1780-N6)-dimethyltransferase [Nematocida sp. LUAm2]KAI5177364.1 18S rRNA (adenine1779-N6/adenine1780-N6)-dimethyltransferase [Nematocida sp. LUAm1]